MLSIIGMLIHEKHISDIVELVGPPYYVQIIGKTQLTYLELDKTCF